MEETTQTTQETQETTNNTAELEAKLAEAEARATKAESEARRFKDSVDRLTKEAAEKKRAALEKLPEVERKAAEAEEELARLREKAEADERELNHLKALAAYKDVADEATVERLIDCVAAGDHAEISKIILEVRNKAIKDQEAGWKKSRPAAFIGDGSFPTITKDEIMAIADPVERQKRIAENINLFR